MVSNEFFQINVISKLVATRAGDPIEAHNDSIESSIMNPEEKACS
jgi:hypothetical protein